MLLDLPMWPSGKSTRAVHCGPLVVYLATRNSPAHNAALYRSQVTRWRQIRMWHSRGQRQQQTSFKWTSWNRQTDRQLHGQEAELLQRDSATVSSIRVHFQVVRLRLLIMIVRGHARRCRHLANWTRRNYLPPLSPEGVPEMMQIR